MSKFKPVAVNNPVNDLMSVIHQAIEEWKTKNTVAAIKKQVMKSLDKQAEAVVFNLLGFEKDRFDKTWRVDHCNGRSNTSAVGSYIKSTQQEAIEEWLKTIPLPELDAKTQKAVIADMRVIYTREIRMRLEQKLRLRIDEDVDMLLDQILDTQFQSDFLKTIQLIQPKQE